MWFFYGMATGFAVCIGIVLSFMGLSLLTKPRRRPARHTDDPDIGGWMDRLKI